MKRKKERSLPVRLFSLLVKLAIAAVILVVGINVYITKSTEKDIAASVDSGETTITSQEVQSFRATDPECIMVLGAAVRPDGTPCKMLRDRLDLGIALYKQGVAPQLLFSGDNGQVVYNEVNAKSTPSTKEFPKRIFFSIMRDFPPMNRCTAPRRSSTWTAWWS